MESLKHFKNRKCYTEKTVLTACFYLVELQKNFKSVHSVGVIRPSISYNQTYSAHTLLLFDSQFEQRAHPRHVPYCREQEMSAGTYTLLRMRCFLWEAAFCCQFRCKQVAFIQNLSEIVN